jgi:hypothetical protein
MPAVGVSWAVSRTKPYRPSSLGVVEGVEDGLLQLLCELLGTPFGPDGTRRAALLEWLPLAFFAFF